MAPLFDVPGITAYSFQFPASVSDSELLRAHGVHELEADLAGYSRAAAYASQLDLCITVDTSFAHLAGALGLPVWLLLASDADWRWGIEGESTPLYAGARLFRQAVGVEWGASIERVSEALRRWAAGGALESSQ
jgi:hypothetical protein